MSDGNTPDVTAVIPARNEAGRITDCIRAVAGFADEVIVVDDASSDDTAALARAAGAKVIEANRSGRRIDYVRKVGFRAARGRWILSIDADERMTSELADCLRDVIREDRYVGVRFARKNMMFGGWARHGGWFVSDQMRFFRADAWDRSWNCAIHSQVPVRGHVLTLPPSEKLATVHHDYDSVPQFIGRTLLRYSQQEAIERYEAGIRFSAWRFMLRPVRRFLGRYIVRGGWRDGARGLVLAALLAAYDLCIEACLWDIGRRGRDAEK